MKSLEVLSLPPVRFAPSKETLAVLNDRKWIANYSGGKDSTTVVTWVEYLRRIGMVKVESPQMVMSDTGIEYPFLGGISKQLMAALGSTGWQCEIVTPKVKDKLYCQIFGRGLAPTHPGNTKRVRWCTRSTKTDPMKRFAKSIDDDVVQITGVRWGESDTRDGKLSASGCAAGGECGLPEPGEGVYGPIITWRTCKVIEWLSGEVEGSVREVIPDLLPIMRQLIDVYEVRKEQEGLFGVPPKTSSMRFGCIGCPAISNEKITESKQGKKHPEWQNIKRLYAMWEELYKKNNRCARLRDGKWGRGPLKMEVRKKYFAELLDIQEKSGIELVTPEDIQFIYQCWGNKVYPRGWSEADELVSEPETGMFADTI